VAHLCNASIYAACDKIKGFAVKNNINKNQLLTKAKGQLVLILRHAVALLHVDVRL